MKTKFTKIFLGKISENTEMFLGKISENTKIFMKNQCPTKRERLISDSHIFCNLFVILQHQLLLGANVYFVVIGFVIREKIY